LFDQVDRIGALNAAGQRVAGASMSSWVAWNVATKVFASSEGALATQMLQWVDPFLMLEARRVRRSFPGLHPIFAGYEVLLDPTLEERVKAFASDSMQLAALPVHPVEIGRVPVVFDGASTAALIAQTLSPALELDRALGFEMDGVGTSFLAPPAQSLGTMVAAPLVSLATNLSLPEMAGVPWDDEGVAPQHVALIDAGRHVDYLTSRGTAAALAPWYRQHHRPLHSNGCVVAPVPDAPPLVSATALTLAPASSAASVDDLVRGVTRGVLFMGASVAMDQGLRSGHIASYNGLVFGIQNGRVTHRLGGAGLQFQAPKLWRSLTALGDGHTMIAASGTVYKGRPPHDFAQRIHAPATLFPAVDLINTKRRLG
jgi:predicted Zn-dependent protease